MTKKQLITGAIVGGSLLILGGAVAIIRKRKAAKRGEAEAIEATPKVKNEEPKGKNETPKGKNEEPKGKTEVSSKGTSEDEIRQLNKKLASLGDDIVTIKQYFSTTRSLLMEDLSEEEREQVLKREQEVKEKLEAKNQEQQAS